MSWLGLDIGGANLKAADGRGWARSTPFPLWREPNGLSSALIALFNTAPSFDCLALTMTGELCDCYRTKVDGVVEILGAVEQAAGKRHIRIYLVDGRLVLLDEVRRSPELAAASNWHALARFAARLVNGDAGLLIDIGSTTADIIPLVNGEPRIQACDDTGRLVSGELVYTGIGRTPICALTNWLPWQGQRCPVAAELFATAADAYVLLGDLPEQPDCKTTADGRPLTKEFARDRLARMICADSTTFGADDAQLAAERVRDAQLGRLGQAVRRVAGRLPCVPDSFVLSGTGEFLAARLVHETWPKAEIASLAAYVGDEPSQCGPAHAVAVLAQEDGQTFRGKPLSKA